MDTYQSASSPGLDNHIDKLFQEVICNGSNIQHSYKYSKKKKNSIDKSEFVIMKDVPLNFTTAERWDKNEENCIPCVPFLSTETMQQGSRQECVNVILQRDDFKKSNIRFGTCGNGEPMKYDMNDLNSKHHISKGSQNKFESFRNKELIKYDRDSLGVFSEDLKQGFGNFESKELTNLTPQPQILEGLKQGFPVDDDLNQRMSCINVINIIPKVSNQRMKIYENEIQSCHGENSISGIPKGPKKGMVNCGNSEISKHTTNTVTTRRNSSEEKQVYGNCENKNLRTCDIINSVHSTEVQETQRLGSELRTQDVDSGKGQEKCKSNDSLSINYAYTDYDNTKSVENCDLMHIEKLFKDVINGVHVQHKLKRLKKMKVKSSNRNSLDELETHNVSDQLESSAEHEYLTDISEIKCDENPVETNVEKRILTADCHSDGRQLESKQRKLLLDNKIKMKDRWLESGEGNISANNSKKIENWLESSQFSDSLTNITNKSKTKDGQIESSVEYFSAISNEVIEKQFNSNQEKDSFTYNTRSKETQLEICVENPVALDNARIGTPLESTEQTQLFVDSTEIQEQQLVNEKHTDNVINLCQNESVLGESRFDGGDLSSETKICNLFSATDIHETTHTASSCCRDMGLEDVNKQEDSMVDKTKKNKNTEAGKEKCSASDKKSRAKAKRDVFPKLKLTRSRSNSWNLIYPEPAQDGLWRSQRTRVPPLEWHKNERIIYDQGIVSGITLSSEVKIRQMEENKKAMLKAKGNRTKKENSVNESEIKENSGNGSNCHLRHSNKKTCAVNDGKKDKFSDRKDKKKSEHHENRKRKRSESSECHKSTKETTDNALNLKQRKKKHTRSDRDKKIVNTIINISKKYLSEKHKHHKQSSQNEKQMKFTGSCKRHEKHPFECNSPSSARCKMCKNKISKTFRTQDLKCKKNDFTGKDNSEKVSTRLQGHCNHCRHGDKRKKKPKLVKCILTKDNSQLLSQETILKSHERNVNSHSETEIDTFRKLSNFEDKDQFEAQDLELLMPRSETVKWSNGKRTFSASGLMMGQSQINHPGGIWKSIIQENNVQS